MTFSFTKKQLGLTVSLSCALALGAAANMASAQTNPAETGYLADQRGAVVKSGFGLCWHNGTGPAPAPSAECDPNFVAAPIAKLDPPAAQPAAAPPKPVVKPATRRVTLAADTLFDFNKAALRPAGQTALDDFVSKSKDINPEVITAVGHADRFGSNAYNQRLSEQRAAAVKTYLISKGIASNRIQTEGKGETQPLTKADECKGAKSAKVIACLQPDRRVDIEVVGSSISN
ncbi:MAG: OmpA family protein [Betaproteobacteria bacterium]|nr:OmpA family protein [Betaproteobacteria bacterium]